MSGFREHITAGIAVGTTYNVVNVFVLETLKTNEYVLIPFASCAIFSIFPDIDIKSKASKFFYLVSLVAEIWLFYQNNYLFAAILGIVLIIPQLCNHRGIFHSKIMAISLPVLISILVTSQGFINNMMAIHVATAGILGYFTHLTLDRLVFH